LSLSSATVGPIRPVLESFCNILFSFLFFPTNLTTDKAVFVLWSRGTLPAKVLQDVDLITLPSRVICPKQPNGDLSFVLVLAGSCLAAIRPGHNLVDYYRATRVNTNQNGHDAGTRGALLFLSRGGFFFFQDRPADGSFVGDIFFCQNSLLPRDRNQKNYIGSGGTTALSEIGKLLETCVSMLTA
jgi:hypothetical protein